MRSGLGNSLHRWLRTGELTWAYLSLAKGDPVRAIGDPFAYGAALVVAGDLLADGGEVQEVDEARAHFRKSRLARDA
ncbi:hypothetical protein [Streptomyces sp. NPDC001315]|uniref:hypothetical protein n=1 Tax=Streptomyces sp. NPDC001315 TaxID=3364562 RepID=UPI0036CB0E64